MNLKKIGRPKGDNNKECGYTIRMDEITLKRLELYCKKMGVLKSQAIRDSINALPLEIEETKQKDRGNDYGHGIYFI